MPRILPALALACACLLLPAGAGSAGEVPAGAAAAAPGADLLDEALALAGLDRATLGWRARGWWAGYPEASHKLRHVDDLFDRPLATVPFARTLGAGARDLLDPARAGERGARGAGWLHRAAHLLGVDRRMGAFRSYSVNLLAEPTPLAEAVLAAHRHAGRPTRYVTFGEESPYPLLEKDVRARCAVLPEAVSGLLGRLVLDLLDAQGWAGRAWRNVPMELRAAVARRLDLGVEEVDALDHEPALDDVLARWDEASLWYAGLKAVEALDRARTGLTAALAALPDAAALRDVSLALDTPLGRLRVRGTGDDVHEAGEAFDWIVVDLGGHDAYRGRVACSDPAHPVSVLLDLGGDDTYGTTPGFEGGTQGVGLVGVGLLLDVAGNDRYEAHGTLAQGAGQLGLGALIDLAGDDAYEAWYGAQGAAWFGVGLLFDTAGHDRYRVRSDGQGFGGAGGVGTLADRAGDDAYEAVVDGAAAGRPSYHTQGKVAVSNAQGCSMGRRGDGADGHSWAGGLGSLLDVEGKDTYVAGNWAQGCGYWFGTGLLWDGAGDDVLRAHGWAQGSGAHFCVGICVDEAGDDVHEVAQDWGPGYGHDFTVGVLYDGGGNDRHAAGSSGLGWSINRSVGLLLDAGGDDTYAFAKAGLQVGTAVFDARLLDRSGPSRYWTESSSLGLLVDAGGRDTYPEGFADGGTRSDAPGSDNVRARNRGVALDRASGTLDVERPQPR